MLTLTHTLPPITKDKQLHRSVRAHEGLPTQHRSTRNTLRQNRADRKLDFARMESGFAILTGHIQPERTRSGREAVRKGERSAVRAVEGEIATENAGPDHFPAYIHAVDDVGWDEWWVYAILVEAGYVFAVFWSI